MSKIKAEKSIPEVVVAPVEKVTPVEEKKTEPKIKLVTDNPTSFSLPWPHAILKSGQSFQKYLSTNKSKPLDPNQQVKVNGEWIEPALTKVLPICGRVVTDKMEFLLPYPYEKYDEIEFSVYEINYENSNSLYLLLDPHSIFEIDTSSANAPYLYPRKNAPVRGLSMVNSESINNTFLGNGSILINCKVENSVINQTTITASIAYPGFSWDFIEEHDGISPSSKEIKFVPGESTRHCYKGISAKNARIQDSVLTKGNYINCNISTSTIESGIGSGANIGKGSSLTETRVTGKEISIQAANICKTVIECKDNVTIHAQSIKSKDLRTDGLYLINKFGYMTINYPGHTDIPFTRITKNEFQLGNQCWSEKITINIKDDEITIKEKLASFISKMGFGNYPLKDTNSLIGKSIFTYAADTVISRINVVNLLDSVVETAFELNQGVSVYTYESVYSE